MEHQIQVGADVDVRALMDEVRAEVARKREQGLYPPEVIEELDLSAGSGSSDDLLTLSLIRLRQSAGFSTAVTTASQMGLAAPVASSFKRVVRGSVRWYMVGILQQVEEFAAGAVHTMSVLADRVRRLEERLDAALDGPLRELEEVRAHARSNAERLDALEAETSGVRARDRLPQLERALRGLRERLDEAGPAAGEASGGRPDGERSQKTDRSIDYLDFENRFLGSEQDRRDRQREYVPLYREASGPVVDLGCGRGEFLEVLGEAGVAGYGVDRNPDMVDRCREKGLDVRQGDVLEHLASVEPGSLGGIFSSQTIEHLEIDDVPRFFELAADALAPGSTLVVETLNPQSLYIFAWAFYIDLGHLRPLHPLTLQYLAEKTGFRDVRAEFFFPPPDELRPAEVAPTGDPSVDRVVEDVNENFRRVDRFVFGPQDYAVVATR